jgi:carboxypeptidase Q
MDMRVRRLLTLSIVTVPVIAFTLVSNTVAAAQKKVATASVAAVATQPVTESLDLDMYARIREEGFRHSHVMEYSSALFDDIGPRLTGSPAMARANEWTRAQLAAMGLSNAHLESWGDFGMGWTQLGSSLFLDKPSHGVIVAQATPWSPATNGVVTADVVAVHGLSEESDFAAYKGKLKGKVILYGHAASSPEIDPNKVPAMEHYDAKKLAEIAQYPLNDDMKDVIPVNNVDAIRKVTNGWAFQEKVAKFFSDEGALLVLQAGGADGILSDDTNSSFGWFVYSPEHKQPIPEEVIATEAWNRMWRLLEQKVPVTVTAQVNTQFNGDHEQGYNTIAEIAGTDPKLKDEVVMVGGHLDSWASGTGATDNGAGSVVAMEAMRILKSLDVKPRRTIRIALWSGEEQGVFGSYGYVQSHYATLHFSQAKEDASIPVFVRVMTAPATLKPEAAKFDAYYNMDNGTGKLLGVFAEGNSAIAPIFKQWMEPLSDLGMTTVSERNTGSTDHVWFQQAGLPGFQFIQDPRDYDSRTHHTSLDVYDHLSPDDLKQAAVIEAIFLYNTAQRDQMLPRPPLPLNLKDKQLEGLFPDAVK